MKIVAFRGSPRAQGNSSLLLNEFIRGAEDAGASITTFVASTVNVKPCRGCLRCNLVKRCTIRNDDWPRIAIGIEQADHLVFATPVWFHHVPGQLKVIIDRFRSFLNVRITETGLQHIPWHSWRKQVTVLLSLGSSSMDDARPVINLFDFITRQLGPDCSYSSIIGTRLAVSRQIAMSLDELLELYPKLGLPTGLAEADYHRNQQLLQTAYKAGHKVTREHNRRNI